MGNELNRHLVLQVPELGNDLHIDTYFLRKGTLDQIDQAWEDWKQGKYTIEDMHRLVLSVILKPFSGFTHNECVELIKSATEWLTEIE